MDSRSPLLVSTEGRITGDTAPDGKITRVVITRSNPNVWPQVEDMLQQSNDVIEMGLSWWVLSGYGPWSPL